MKPLAIAFIYNELPYLPAAIAWYKSQGCNLFFIDNNSTDKSREYLIKQNIPYIKYNTGNAFHLEKLQAKLIEVVHKLKPNWFLWFAPDLFHVFKDKTIAEAIQLADAAGHTRIKSVCHNFKNTGETFNTPLFDYFEYFTINTDVLLCVKYNPEIKIIADTIKTTGTAQPAGLILEYGSCKPPKTQNEKLQRRQKAWKQGLNRNFGVHYKLGKARNWIYDKADLIHISAYPGVMRSVEKLRNLEF